MKSHIQKDKKKRHLYKRYELKRRMYKLLLLQIYEKQYNPSNNCEAMKNRLTAPNSENQYLMTNCIRLLQNLPRNSSLSRIRNRCMITGRARGVLSSYKISRITFRQYANQGRLPGITKASW